MADRPWSRRRRRRGDGTATAENDNVHLNDEEHAWWAARDELASGRVPQGRRRRRAPEEPKQSAFEQYYTSESLFDWSGDDADGEHVLDHSDPYVVLGLPTSATWEEISSAHRRLAKLHHPDHQQDATPEERARCEERIRQLNIAYTELRHRKGR